MATRTIGIPLLAALLLLAPSDRVEGGGSLTFYNGYAVFDYGVSTGGDPGAPDVVTMEAHARASNAGITTAASLVVRVEFPRPFMPLTSEPAYGVLVLELPSDVLAVQSGTFRAADGFFDALYYEVSEEDNVRLFTTHRWDGELSWLHPPDPRDGDLRLITRLRAQDDGPDGAPDTADDRFRDLTSATIRLFLTLSPVALPGGDDVYVPDDEIYVSGEVVTYYDDGCSDDPTVDNYDEYYGSDDSTYYGEDDSGCDGDTWDDDGRDSGADSSCDDDWDDDDSGSSDDWDSGTDWGGWEGDEWASSPRRADGRIRGMALPGVIARALRVHRRPLRVVLPLALCLLFTLGLKCVSRRR
ncbi:MAG: hypothetical protein ABIK09_11765, partial [Pseudomonadota bacterium]